jgi:hypothetical protein
LIETALQQISVTTGTDRFRLMEPKEETPQGQWFRALDEHRGQPIDIFVFARDLVADPAFC